MRDLIILVTVMSCAALTPGCNKDDKKKSATGDPAKPAATSEQPTNAAAAKPAKPAVKAIPDGYHTVTPILTVDSVEDAVAFYSKIFAAKQVLGLPGPDGKLLHAELQIGDSRLMLSPEMPGQGKSPHTLKGTTGSLLVYVADTDAVTKSAIEAGAIEAIKVMDQFWGDRWGMVIDPFGHAWGIATHKIDVPPEKMAELSQTWQPDGNVDPPGMPARHWQPERLNTIVPTIHITGGAAALSFYKDALGAEVSEPTLMPDGKTLMHAELMLGDSTIMVSDENPAMHTTSPKTLGGTSLSLFVYTADVDAAFAKAVAASAVVKAPVEDRFWGDRLGLLADPSGHEWGLATHKEEVSPEEMGRRMNTAMAGQAPE